MLAILYEVCLIQLVNVLANVSVDAMPGTFQAVHLPTIYFSEITVNIIYHHCRGFPHSLLSSVFDQNFIFFCVPCICYKSHTTQSPWCYQPNSIRWTV